MKEVLLAFALFTCITHQSFSQGVSIGIGATAPDSSAILELSAVNKGFLPPRLTTTERDNILNPATGLIIYNTNTHTLNYYNGTQWLNTDPGLTTVTQNISLLNSSTVNGNDGFAYAITDAGFSFLPLPYLNQGYRDTFSTNQVVLYGISTTTFVGNAYAFDSAGVWKPQSLQYVNQGYKATASRNQIVLFGTSNVTGNNGYAYGLAANGTWVTQVLPYMNQGYKSIASENQVVLYGTTNTGNPGIAFAFKTDGTWISQTLPYLNQGYKSTASRNQIVVFGTSNVIGSSGSAFLLTSNGNWVSQSLPYIIQGYGSSSTRN
jgi:hypothetical protein